MIKTLDSQKRH